MQRTPFAIAAAAASLCLALAWGGSVAGQEAFATNTPRPAPAFATNTPHIMAEAVTDEPTLTPSPSATLTPSLTFTPSPTVTPIGPLWYPDGISPLTGLPFPSQEAMDRRNLIIKISNFPPQVRPQSGLNQADVVYEYEVEGGVTRFAAIFRSHTPRHVGPVRSGRLLDMELAPMYQALLAYSGASAPVQALLLSQPWSLQVISPSIGDNCAEAGFCRFPGVNLAYEHTLYADPAMIWERATRRGVNQGYRARGFAFNETPDANGTPALDIALNWYGQIDARWQYDPVSARYLRFTDGVPHYDRLDGQQLWADNIVVIEVPHEERPDLFESESRSASQQINLWDSGRAYVFRDGQWYQGLWQRRNREPGSALDLMYGDGTPIMLRPGRTYVEVMRWIGDAAVSDVRADMPATAAALAASATATATPSPGPSQTPDATLAPGVTLYPQMQPPAGG